MKKIACLLLGLLMVSLASHSLLAADDKDIKKHPGYVNFDAIDMPKDAEETVEVYLRGPLLTLISKASKREDPGLAKILSKLQLIRVNTFSIDSHTKQQIEPTILKIERDLQKQKWQKIVRVKEPDELVNIYLKMDNRDRIV